jgi:type I restriction enzyme R subunit
MNLNEADTRRTIITPALVAAGWDTTPHTIVEEYTISPGRIIANGQRQPTRQAPKYADYLLRYRDKALAVVEAKAENHSIFEGVQQAKNYALLLDLPFAYVANEDTIMEIDLPAGTEHKISRFPTPDELWARYEQYSTVPDAEVDRFLTPVYTLSGKAPRYYQEIAINRTVAAVLRGDQRILLTMATGTGKTVVAFQICWKLHTSMWNRDDKHRRPKILYLADRNVLIDDPKDKTFAPFKDARYKIEHGQIIKSREMYFAIYQALTSGASEEPLYKQYDPAFFDLVIVDECHRGSARSESSWREILDYFAPAVQIGLTATPKRDDNVDTYQYFGDPIFQYSLKQGIEDGYLAPYRVYRVISSYDTQGWRPGAEELAQGVPDEEGETRDLPRSVALRQLTQAIARHLTTFLHQTNRFAKTIVFCVDQEHAAEMRMALINMNSDLVRQYPIYVCRVTSDDKDVGRSYLSSFQDVETTTPTILTTSQMLTTGVDAPTVENVVLARVVNSMTEFKQIIGRGTRVRDDYGKLVFNIIDYTNSATRLFADPDFDGPPISTTEEPLGGDEGGERGTGSGALPPDLPLPEPEPEPEAKPEPPELPELPEDEGPTGRPHPAYAYDGPGSLIGTIISELDEQQRLRAVGYINHTRGEVLNMEPAPQDIVERWRNQQQRQDIIAQLEARNINLDELAAVLARPDADALDLLLAVAFEHPIRSRTERAAQVRERRAFFERYGPEARAVLDALLEKYAAHGVDEFTLPDVLKLSPIAEQGDVSAIAAMFGGAAELKDAVDELQRLLYAA